MEAFHMFDVQTDHLLRIILCFYGFMMVLGPIALHSQFRLRAKIQAQPVPKEALPDAVRNFMEPRIPGLQALGFEFVSYVNLGSLTGGTQSFMALLTNRSTSEWADVSVVFTKIKFAGYTEFISRCSEDLQVDTNTNSTAGVLSPDPTRHVFHFPRVKDPWTLLRLHRMLVAEKTGGMRPVIPPAGQEIAELQRRLERYGPRQQERGYLYLDSDGETYRLTWKGAIFAAWRSVWPVPAIRSWRMSQLGATRLRALGVASQT
jgi:hypothetical protein